MENNIRLGKISAIDYAAGTVRVVYHEKDDAVTAPIPLISSEYFMPEVDDMVMVLHLSNGTEAGVVLGRPWSEKNKPPEGSKGLYRKDLARSPGEAMIRYKDGTMTIMASKKITINAPEVEFLEKVTVKKETTLKKTLLVEKQITTHDGVTATNDVKAGTISLQQHKHTTQGLTSPTTPPIP